MRCCNNFDKTLTIESEAELVFCKPCYDILCDANPLNHRAKEYYGSDDDGSDDVGSNDVDEEKDDDENDEDDCGDEEKDEDDCEEKDK